MLKQTFNLKCKKQNMACFLKVDYFLIINDTKFKINKNGHIWFYKLKLLYNKNKLTKCKQGICDLIKLRYLRTYTIRAFVYMKSTLLFSNDMEKIKNTTIGQM